jgi:hypothetical protein
MLANELERRAVDCCRRKVRQETTSLHNEVSKPAKPRRQRKPSLRTLIAQAEKSGKPVSSIATPEGTKLTFGEPESEKPNELDEWIAKRAH